MAPQKRKLIAGCSNFELRFEPLADDLVLTSLFEGAERQVANFKQLLPLIEQLRRIFREHLFRLGEKREMNAGFAPSDGRQILPDLIGCEAEDRRNQPNQCFSDLPEHCLR